MLHKKLVVLLLALFGLVGVMFSPTTVDSVEAQGCYELPAYTDYYLGKPALIVYHPGGHPVQSQVHTYFYNNGLYQWEPVPNSNWGVNFGSPQLYSGGWSYYFIATRWILIDGAHDWWNVDSFWEVLYC